MKKSMAVLMVIVLSLWCGIGQAQESPSTFMETMVEYLEIGTGDFEQYDMAFYISASGYGTTDVVFSFGLEPGNQMITVTYGQDASAYVVASLSHPEKVLSAFVTLLPYFDEIQSVLPDEYTLMFMVYNGEVHGRRYAIQITKDGYSTLYE